MDFYQSYFNIILKIEVIIGFHRTHFKIYLKIEMTLVHLGPGSGFLKGSLDDRDDDVMVNDLPKMFRSPTSHVLFDGLSLAQSFMFGA